MAKFKVGDRVKKVRNNEGHGNGCGLIGSFGTIESNGEVLVDGYGCCDAVKDFELVKNAPNIIPKFLLQYEIDSDPIEEFTTLIAVKKRIKELVPKGGHSFIVWEIKKKIVLDVSKVENIVIKGI